MGQCFGRQAGERLEAADDQTRRALRHRAQCQQQRPLPAGELRKRAGLSGFNWRTVHRAKDRMGIAVIKSGMAGAWMWKLRDIYSLSPSANRVTFAQNEGFACHLHGTFEDDTKMTTPPKMTTEDDSQTPHIMAKMTHTPEDDSQSVSRDSAPAATVEGTL